MLSFYNLLLDLVFPLIHKECGYKSGSMPCCSSWNLWSYKDGELAGVTGGQRFIEFLPVMINRAGVVIASEVIRGMPELSCNPVSLHLRLRFPSLIHCSLLLVIPGANEEAVIDLRGQRPLCSAGSYQRGSGFKPRRHKSGILGVGAHSRSRQASSSVHARRFFCFSFRTFRGEL